MLHFQNPQILWFLLALPLVPFLLGKRGRSAALQYSSVELLRKVGQLRQVRAGNWLMTLRILALAGLVVGLARPQLGEGRTEIQANGIDIMLALDISGSMAALDFEQGGQPISRIDIVRDTVAKFIQERPDDRIGLVAFAGQPFLISPLTLDHSWLLQNLQRVHLGLGEDGTAIGSGIATCINRLRQETSKSKIIILLTDGNNNMGKIAPLTSADAARALGIKIYTIGAGTRGKAPLPIKDQNGQERIVMINADVDEDTLQKMAQITGGRFYRATETQSLQNIYAEINQLEKTEHTFKKFEHYQELFAWAVIPSLLLLGAELGLANTRWRRLP